MSTDTITTAAKAVRAAAEKYLADHIPEGATSRAGIMSLLFLQTHGEKALQHLADYIAWAEANDIKPQVIAETLAHDLGGCTDSFMLPRSDGYTHVLNNYNRKEGAK